VKNISHFSLLTSHFSLLSPHFGNNHQMKNKIIQYFSIALIIISIFPLISRADLTEGDLKKREKIKYALGNGIIGMYDVPFETYFRLEMWDEINFIFESNNKNMLRYELPGLYYSRPYIMDNTLWIFENASGRGGGIYVFASDTLNLIKKPENKAYQRYDGGVRKIFGHTVISGGSDADVDTAVIWDTDTDEVRTVKLQDGHYVSSVEMKDGNIYIGSCGGVINAWKYDDLNFMGIYSSSKKENTDWNVFNEKECIANIGVLNGKLVGAGEKTIFIWNLDSSGAMPKTYPKTLTNSAACFYGNYLIEYKNERIVVRETESGRLLRETKAEKTVEDLIVTPEKILANHEGDLLIVSLRRNKGIHFYDFKTLTLLRKIAANGESLAGHRKALFATDDRHVFRYDIAHKDAEKYEAFLNRISPQDIVLTDKTYYQLLKRLESYPEIVEKLQLSDNFLKMNNLSIRHSFKYGKIGERNVSPEEDIAGSGYKEDIHGYKVYYEVENRSAKYCFVELNAQWSGEYGENMSHENGTWEMENSSGRGFARQTFFLVPNKTYKNSFQVGGKEPVNLLIYPARIEEVTQRYYDRFMRAITDGNSDISLIDEYLRDNLVKDWHEQLREKRNKLAGKENETFWFFKREP